MKSNREKSQILIDEMSNYVIYEPKSFVIDLKKSKGMMLATVDGDMIFDWAGYYGSKLISHNHQGLFEDEYLQDLIYAANNKVANPDFLTTECLVYYRKLHQLAPKIMKNDKLEVYVVNSGAEAVENMMKYFINLHDIKLNEKGIKSNSHRFIYFDNAFHGRTVFALNITRISHDPVATQNFETIFNNNIQVPFPEYNSDVSKEENLKVMQKCLDIIKLNLSTYKDQIAGIIMEPIQGSGGHRIALPEFYTKLSELAHEYDVNLGFDEVQTAGGQLGSFFAIDSFNLPYPPQAVASGKKLGNGVIYMYNSMNDVGILDSTWGGTLSDMVRFVQEMKIVEREKLMEQIPEKSEYFIQKLVQLKNKYPNLICNIRGMGVYQGFSLVKQKDKSRLIQLALENENLLLLGAGTQSIRFRPVIDVSISDIDLLCEKLDSVMNLL